MNAHIALLAALTLPLAAIAQESVDSIHQAHKEARMELRTEQHAERDSMHQAHKAMKQDLRASLKEIPADSGKRAQARAEVKELVKSQHDERKEMRQEQRAERKELRQQQKAENKAARKGKHKGN
ncbi:MAG: hypothetical protein H6686_00740 [Fibrobacteria bacterium]|nr:hypothetical protein [Fibrobacteria bacterium]